VIIPAELTNGQSSVARSVSIHQPHHTPAIQLEAVIITGRSDIRRSNVFNINYRFKIFLVLLRIGNFLVSKSVAMTVCVEFMGLSVEIPQEEIK